MGVSVPHIDLYRYEGEKEALTVSILILLIVGFGLFALSLGTVLFVLFLSIMYIRIKQGQLLGTSALVTGDNFARVHGLVGRAAARLGMAAPRVHVRQDPYLNAYAMGFSEPFSVVLHSTLVQSLTDDELLFIIGHELGHIKGGHTVWLSMIAPFGKTIPGFDFIFGFWQRKAEYTADRAGLLSCGNLDAAITALIKMSSGPYALEHTDVDRYLRQARELDRSELDRVGELFGTHPYVTNRIKEIIRFHRRPPAPVGAAATGAAATGAAVAGAAPAGPSSGGVPAGVFSTGVPAGDPSTKPHGAGDRTGVPAGDPSTKPHGAGDSTGVPAGDPSTKPHGAGASGWRAPPSGGGLEPRLACPACAAPTAPEHRFCTQCGTALTP